MIVGFIGLGRLGLPVSISMSLRGHKVYGYEVMKKRRDEIRNCEEVVYEPNIKEWLRVAQDNGYTVVDSMTELVLSKPEIIFIAVPTPSRVDNSFDTKQVVQAVMELGVEYRKNFYSGLTVAIISTILPRTMREEIQPALEKSSLCRVGIDIGLIYNASFIAMGTTIYDYYDPEFVLVGEPFVDSKGGDIVEQFYKTIVGKSPILRMTWENAELTKMAYNTMIGFKIIFANTIMEVCDKIPTGNCDVVSNALSKATRRLISPAYLKGGMGDGGACHPRDNRALSYMARELYLSCDPFDFIMDSRTKQAEYIAKKIYEQMSDNLSTAVIMGGRYKENTNLTFDASSLQVKEILEGLLPDGCNVVLYDPMLEELPEIKRPAVFLIGHKFDFCKEFPYGEGSVVIDPWGWLSEKDLKLMKGVKYISVGRQ